MDNARKAALLSALLFPGWGQIYLKHYKRGVVFIIAVLAGTLSLAIAIILSGRDIIRAAPFKKGTVQFTDIVGVFIKSITAIDIKLFLPMILMILLLWILSIVDAYQLAKQTPASSTTGADQESTFDRS